MKIVQALLHESVPFQKYKQELSSATSLFLSAHVHSIANIIFRQGAVSVVGYGSDRFEWFKNTIVQMFEHNKYHTTLLHQMFAEQFYVTEDLIRHFESIVECQEGAISVAQRRILEDILQGSWRTVWNLQFITERVGSIVRAHRIERKLAVCMGLHMRLNEYSLLRLLHRDNLSEICLNI